MAAFRRHFAQLEPAGKRWWHYDSLKTMLDAGEFEELHAWLAAP